MDQPSQRFWAPDSKSLEGRSEVSRRKGRLSYADIRVGAVEEDYLAFRVSQR
jgi:hypothetical protein